jgi:hypothetical protein
MSESKKVHWRTISSRSDGRFLSVLWGTAETAEEAKRIAEAKIDPEAQIIESALWTADSKEIPML